MKRLVAGAAVVLLAACGGGGSPETIASPSSSELKVVISKSTGNTYIVKGENFSNLGGIKVTVKYDTDILQNPHIVKGSLITDAAASMFMANSSVPGTIIIAAINPSAAFNGSGAIAVLTFERLESTNGGISSMSAELVEQRGDQTRQVSPTVEVNL